MTDRTRFWRFARSAFMVAVFAGMVFALYRMLESYSYDDVAGGFSQVSATAVLIAAGLIVVEYALLAGREWLAVRYAGRADLGWRRSALASTIARPLSALGVATITGIGLRIRIYSEWGLTSREIGLVTAYNEITFHIGVAMQCAVALIAARIPWPESMPVWLPPTWIVGVIGLVVAAAYVVVVARRREHLQIRKLVVPIPDRVQLAAQLVSPVLDLLIVAGVVHVLLPASAGLPYFELVAVCLIANLAGSLSQVPAGLGVFEAVMLQFVSPAADPAAVLAALLVRRLIANVFPMAVGALLLIWEEVRRRPQLRPGWHDDAIAIVLSVLTFVGGVILLVLSVEPQIRGALAPPGAPGPLVMFVSGVVMLIVARGLQRRTHRAWRIALILLAIRAVADLATGVRPLILAIIAAQALILIACRRVFSERGVVLHAGLASWWAAFAMAVIGAISVAVFAEGDPLSRLGALRLVAVVVIASIAGGVIAYRIAKHRREAAATPTT